MSTIIMDLCSYTRLGLTGYLLSRGVKKREINDIETVDDLAIACDSQRPSVVFINEDCFIHDASNSQRIKHIIMMRSSSGKLARNWVKSCVNRCCIVSPIPYVFLLSVRYNADSSSLS